MKTIKNILVTISLITVVISANSQCVQCDNNSNALGSYSSVIGMSTTTTADSDGAFAGGIGSTADGAFAFAFGQSALAQGGVSFALGASATASNSNSFALGTFCTASGSQSFVFGNGVNSSSVLNNQVGYSLMIGFNSDKPTFFVGQSNGAGTTGKVGIGNITDPQAKLHIKGDENGVSSEDADILLEPGSSMKYARLKFGTTGNKIEARGSLDLNFHTASDFVFWDGNVGIGTANPTRTLDVNGDIIISKQEGGLVLKSPDGQCWKITVDNMGNVSASPDSCTLTGAKPFSGIDNKVNIFPNPAGKRITVSVQNIYERTLLSIYDNKGVLLAKKELSTGENIISLRKMPEGLLILKVNRRNGELLDTEKIYHR